MTKHRRLPALRRVRGDVAAALTSQRSMSASEPSSGLAGLLLLLRLTLLFGGLGGRSFCAPPAFVFAGHVGLSLVGWMPARLHCPTQRSVCPCGFVPSGSLELADRASSTGELGVVERCVGALRLEQRLVRTLLDDLAVFHHEDDVGATDGREPVGDDEAGAIGS